MTAGRPIGIAWPKGRRTDRELRPAEGTVAAGVQGAFAARCVRTGRTAQRLFPSGATDQDRTIGRRPSLRAIMCRTGRDACCDEMRIER
ncbi:hypothetical protein EDF56_101443 [Novosphingobium sp. PhB165]|nr:hypothetical protein EDF56_101443 [Novosphingobium sp. PhB165]